MGKITSLRELVGLIKDKASLSKATLTAASNRSAVIRATAHSPLCAPSDRHISAVLLSGETSRATASPIIAAVMERLHRTGDSVVALKCLLLIHHIIRRGSFILQDQLSIFPATGGRNYLNLSNFNHRANAATWALSAWVRWYARFLETLLSTSRIVGYFLCSSSAIVKENQERRISSLLNPDLIKELDSLIVLIEEICIAPEDLAPQDDHIVKEITGMFLNDYLSTVNEILLRLGELNERLGSLSISESVEVVCGLKRLQDSRERLSILYAMNKPSIEMMWGLAQELKDKIAMLNREGGKFLTSITQESGSESPRSDHRSFSIYSRATSSILAMDKSIRI